jgi:hypothetical protein
MSARSTVASVAIVLATATAACNALLGIEQFSGDDGGFDDGATDAGYAEDRTSGNDALEEGMPQPDVTTQFDATPQGNDAGSEVGVPDAGAADTGTINDASSMDSAPEVGCIDAAVCAPNQSQCLNRMLQTCDFCGQWGSATQCPYACNGDACAACAPNDLRCSNGAQEQTCGADGQWGALMTCVNGCTNTSCVSDSGVCNLYLGAANSRSTTPPTPLRTNPSIQSSTYTFTVGTSYALDVQLQNHDTVAGCSESLVDLYWSDPTTSILIVASQKIPANGTPVHPIGFATTIPPADGSVVFHFTWTPDAKLAATNGGHVVLVAIASCTTTDCVAPPPCNTGQFATTGSPLLAVHDIQVDVATGTPESDAGDGGAD